MNVHDRSDVIYGRWPVKEALESGPVQRVFLAKGTKGDNLDDIVSLAKEKRVMCDWVDRRKLDQMSGTDTHQGIVAQVAPFQLSDLEDIWEEALASTSSGARVLFLDGIMDPQNLGSLLRSAVFFGVSGVVIPKWRAASVTATVVRASAGAARLIKIAQVANLPTAMEAGKKAGLWIVGADMDGVNAKKADLPRPFALVMGSEGEGLHDLVRKKCDVIVGISRTGLGKGVASLNVGVAGGILLHQFG
jgi:23S rRNA (guanosine2251-2'-O)-methyltransferase